MYLAQLRGVRSFNTDAREPNRMATSAETTDNNTSNDFFNHITTIRASIQQHYASLIDAIKQREYQLLLELYSIEQTYREEYQKHQTTIEMLENGKKFILETIFQNIFSEDIKDLRNNMVKLVDEKIKSIKLKIESKQIAFEWDTHLSNAVLQIGRLISLEESASLSIDYKNKVDPLLKTGKQGFGAGEISHPWGVAADSITNNIYVVDFSSSRVCVFSSEGNYLFQFNGNVNNTIKMNHPIGIAVNKNKVFVSQHSSHCIQIYNLDGTYIQQFGSQITDKNQLFGPYGIAISPINGDIYVCDNNNSRVQIFSRGYKHKSFLLVKQLPIDIKLTQHEIFILHNNPPCVHVYDYNASFLRSPIHKTGYGYTIGDSCCMFVDCDNNIILSDIGTHSVLVFSYTGDIIHQIGNTDKMFTYPRGVMIDALGRLVVVSNQKDACIQIF